MRNCVAVGVFVLIVFLLLTAFVSLPKGFVGRTKATGAMGITPLGTSPPSTYPPPALGWAFPYGGTVAEEAHSVQMTKDGGFIVAGYTNPYPLDEQIVLKKIDENGTLQWSQVYGGDKNDRAYSVQQTIDGGYIIAGDTNSFGAGLCDAYLIKAYANRTVEWSRTYGGTNGDYAYSVQQTVDGGYIVGGSTVNGTDLWILKTSSGGILEWNQTYASPDVDEAYSVRQTMDGGFVLAGTVYHAAECQGVLVRADPNGSLIWRKEYGSSNDFSNDYFWSVQENSNGSFICAGWTDSSGAGGVDSWLVKTDNAGNQQWSQAYGGLEDEYTYAVIQTNDTGYVLAGYTNSFGAGGFDVYVVKTFSDGNMQWSQTIGRADGDFGTCVCEAKDKGYVVAGYTLSYGDASCNFYALKIVREDADGDSLYDSWEQKGVDCNGDGTVDLILPGANWKHKDLFVEVDYMGSNGTHDHKPDTEAIEQVKTAFKNAPVKNPDNTEGVNLHVDIDEEVPHQNVIKMFDDYDTIKTAHFGNITQRNDENSENILEAKKQIYHYCLFVHQYSTNETGSWISTTSSGLAECPGNDFIVSLGGWTGGRGSRDEQAGTFMHEFGHNLNLGHGGGDNVNYKPNYLSIMSYAFQFPDLNPNRPLDYSRIKLPDLDEGHLNENQGVGAEVTGQMLMTVFSNRWGNGSILSAAFTPIDWNQNGNSTEMDVSANINNFRVWGEGNSGDEILAGYNDWENLLYNFRELNNFADNAHGLQPTDDLTWEIVQQMRETAESSHDVAILNISTSSSMIPTGSSLNLSVTVMNQGGSSEVLEVSVHANSTPIASEELTLDSWNTTTLNLAGATSGFSEGSYMLSALVNPVVNENDIGDNTYNYGTLTVTAKSASWVEWNQSYPTNAEGRAYSVCQTTDGGYAIAGETDPHSYPDFLLIKTYPNGTEQWSKTYTRGQYCNQEAQSMQQTSDGGYILAGYLQEPQLPTCLWLVKTDSDGNELWNKTFRGDPGSHGYWVSQTSDGGYIAAGVRISLHENASARSEMWLIKTDSEGNELWNRTYSGIDWAEAYSVWQTTDGGYVIGGYYDSPESIVGAALLVKTDSLGNEQWNRTYTDARLFSLQQTADEGYILAGAMYHYLQIDGSDFWLLKADSNGNTEWNKTYDCVRWPENTPSDDEAYCVQQTSDGGYVLAGESYAEDRRAWIVKTDSDGNMQTDLIFDEIYLDPSIDYTARSIQETSDGAYIATGYTQLNHPPNPQQIFLVRFSLLLVIPEFPSHSFLSILIATTLAAIVLSRRRKASKSKVDRMGSSSRN